MSEEFEELEKMPPEEFLASLGIERDGTPEKDIAYFLYTRFGGTPFASLEAEKAYFSWTKKDQNLKVTPSDFQETLEKLFNKGVLGYSKSGVYFWPNS